MLIAHIDGACEPVNPGGTASYGVVVYRDNYQNLLYTTHGTVGTGALMSNNVGEYSALLAFLNWLAKQPDRLEKVEVRADSQLVIRQMTKVYRVKGGLYFDYYRQCISLMDMHIFWPRITFIWIPREQNTLADQLSKTALTEKGRL